MRKGVEVAVVEGLWGMIGGETTNGEGGAVGEGLRG